MEAKNGTTQPAVIVGPVLYGFYSVDFGEGSSRRWMTHVSNIIPDSASVGATRRRRPRARRNKSSASRKRRVR